MFKRSGSVDTPDRDWPAQMIEADVAGIEVASPSLRSVIRAPLMSFEPDRQLRYLDEVALPLTAIRIVPSYVG